MLSQNKKELFSEYKNRKDFQKSSFAVFLIGFKKAYAVEQKNFYDIMQTGLANRFSVSLSSLAVGRLVGELSVLPVLSIQGGEIALIGAGNNLDAQYDSPLCRCNRFGVESSKVLRLFETFLSFAKTL